MKTVKVIILTLSFFCFTACLAYFSIYFVDHYQTQKDLDELKNQKELITSAAIINSKDPENKLILLQYEALYKENNDLIGWIEIDHTPINYPVMQNKQDGEYYLHRNFDTSMNTAASHFWMKNAILVNPVRT